MLLSIRIIFRWIREEEGFFSNFFSIEKKLDQLKTLITIIKVEMSPSASDVIAPLIVWAQGRREQTGISLADDETWKRERSMM